MTKEEIGKELSALAMEVGAKRYEIHFRENLIQRYLGRMMELASMQEAVRVNEEKKNAATPVPS